MKIPELYKRYLAYPNVVTDTRKVVNDAIFFALKGASFDGNLFAEKAIALGAKYAIVDNESIADKSENLIYVNNVLETLQQLATYHREQLNIPIIGITGTNGKTTTKELVNAVLSKKYQVLATQGNFNNHIGVPLTLLSINNTHEIAIIEMGANHVGEIAELCKIAKPNIGLVTNVGLAHLEGFKSFENIVKTKSALYEYVFKNGGDNYILSENEVLKAQFSEHSFLEYSVKNQQKAFYGYANNTVTGLSFNLKKLDGTGCHYQIPSHLVGVYNESNILAAITIGHKMNVEIKDIISAIEHYHPTNNRSQILATKRNKLILDAYNANPSSVENAIINFKELAPDSKTIVLGDMFELGNHEAEKHQYIVDLLAKYHFNQVVLIGNAFSKTKTKENFFTFQNTEDPHLQTLLKGLSQQTILIKGSRGMHLEDLVEFL